MIDARYLFEKLGYEYGYIDNSKDNCENIIYYIHKEANREIHFNLDGHVVVFLFNNKFQDCSKIAVYLSKELIRAIDLQIEELGWVEDEK